MTESLSEAVNGQAALFICFFFFVVRQGESWSVRQKMAKWAVTQFVSRKSTGHIWCRMICSYLPAVQPAAASTLTAYLLEICTLHNPVKKPLILLLRLSVCALDSLCLKCLRLFFWQNVSDPKEEKKHLKSTTDISLPDSFCRRICLTNIIKAPIFPVTHIHRSLY